MLRMLRFVTEHHSPGRISRNEFLRIAGFGSLASAVARPGRADDARGAIIDGVPRAKSVIVVFASGGQSQLDMWDPKPGAPAEIRGEFAPIATSAPGAMFTEYMPRIARLADQMTVVRTMSHADLDHGSAVYLTMTGQYHARITSNPDPSPNDAPSLMSIYQRVRPNAGTIAPTIEVNGPLLVSVDNVSPGQFGGFLGRDYDPMLIGDVTQGTALPGLTPQRQLPAVRLQNRERLLAAIDRTVREQESSVKLREAQTQYDRAFELLADSRTRQAFDLSQESRALRDRYGRHRSGQACLLARRLAEAGVPLITVVWNHRSRGQDKYPDQDEDYGWDTHNDIFDALKNRLMPRFDESFSALLEDLSDRRMLEDTLVLCLSEFGRAPLVALEPKFAGASPGRKHWAAAYSIAMAGAGVARGKIVGKTDRHGGYPASESYGPWDVSATILAALGVSPTDHYFDPLGRPMPVTIGTPIVAAFA